MTNWYMSTADSYDITRLHNTEFTPTPLYVREPIVIAYRA